MASLQAPAVNGSTDYTVIIPAYDAAVTIGESIASIRAQSRVPRRIIVVDDGSTDETAAIAAPYADVIRQENAGPGAACNRGLVEVDTPFVAYLDADDLWLPEKAATQLAVFAATPSVAGVFARLRLFRHGMAPEPDAPVREGWGRTTMMMRTEAVRATGPIYDPRSGGRGDMVDWIARAREMGFVLEMLPSVLALRRIIPGSMSFGRDDRDVGYLDVARRALARRRAQREPGEP